MTINKLLILGLMAFGLALAGPATVTAQSYDTLRAGPEIGGNFANAINNVDQTGKVQTFQTISQGKGVILMFNRSYFW